MGDFAVLRLDLHPIAAVKTNKLSAQKLPPLRVLEVLLNGRAIRLELPDTLKIHPVVSVQHVDKWLPDEFNRAPPGLSHIHRVPKSIFDKRVTRGGRIKYKVEFEGLDMAHAEWWDKADVSVELIEEFERRARERHGDGRGQPMAALAAELNLAFKTSSETTDSTVSLDSDFSSRRRPRVGRSVERPVVYISRVTKLYERNYKSTKQELACVV